MIKLITPASALAVMLFSAPAFAQTAPAPAEPPAATPAPSTPSAPAAAAPTVGAVEYIAAQAEGQWLASNFIGETVRGTGDQNIGEINDILIDKDGSVVAAVIGVGGFLGIGEKNVAVPFKNLKLSNEPDEIISLAATREQLKSAAEFMDLDDQDDARVARERGNVANPAGGSPPAARPPVTTPARPTAPAPAQ
jgi:hypothetical protein